MDDDEWRRYLAGLVVLFHSGQGLSHDAAPLVWNKDLHIESPNYGMRIAADRYLRNGVMTSTASAGPGVVVPVMFSNRSS